MFSIPPPGGFTPVHSDDAHWDSLFNTSQNAQQAAMQALDSDHQALKMKIEMAKTKQKQDAYKSDYPETLKFPLIPEVNPDGTKSLWKSRYEKLENVYGKIHIDFKNFEKGYWEEVNKNHNLMEALVKLDKEVKVLKANNVDSVVVQKRMEQVCNELGISFPSTRGSSLETRLNSFFGAIWVRLRAEVKDDELAE